MTKHYYYELVNQLISVNYKATTPDSKISEEKALIISSLTGEQKKIEETANVKIRESRSELTEQIKKIRDDKSYLSYEVDVEFNGLRAFIVEYKERFRRVIYDYKILNLANGYSVQNDQDIDINFNQIKEIKLKIVSLFEEIASIH